MYGNTVVQFSIGDSFFLKDSELKAVLSDAGKRIFRNRQKVFQELTRITVQHEVGYETAADGKTSRAAYDPMQIIGRRCFVVTFKVKGGVDRTCPLHRNRRSNEVVELFFLFFGEMLEDSRWFDGTARVPNAALNQVFSVPLGRILVRKLPKFCVKVKNVNVDLVRAVPCRNTLMSELGVTALNDFLRCRPQALIVERFQKTVHGLTTV